jgi:hypothetical protein
MPSTAFGGCHDFAAETGPAGLAAMMLTDVLTPSRIRRCRAGRGRVLLLAAAVGLGWSCGREPSSGPDTRVATLTLSDSILTVQVGFRRQLRAEPRTAQGALLDGIPVAWSSDHPELAFVGTDGLVAAHAPGVAHVTATAAGLHVTATVTVIPGVVASVALSRTSALLSPGRSLRLSATPLDSLGQSVPDRTVTFASSDTAVAQVEPDGTVTAGALGTATITASADAGTGALALRVIPAAAILIEVSAVAAVGTLGPAGFAVTLSTGDDSLVVVDSAGAPTQLVGALALPDTVWLRGRAGTDAFVLGGLKALSGALPASVPVVFIPRVINIASGSFVGQSSGVSMPAAVAPCLLASPQCAAGFGFYPAAFRTGVTAWDTLPVPVEVDGFSISDTTLIWSALRAMEGVVGRRLFEPGAAQSGGIVVTPGLPVGVSGFAGYAEWSVDGRSRITSAHVWLASLRFAGIVQHEFLHALGFGHTCSWPSVMGGYGCAQSVALTAPDVAYYLLARAVFDAETPLRLPGGELPCGAMGVWAAAQPAGNFVVCNGDAFESAMVRRPVLAPRRSPATVQPEGRTFSMP